MSVDPKALDAIRSARRKHLAAGRTYLSPQFWGPEHFQALNEHYVKHGFDDRVVDPEAASKFMKENSTVKPEEFN